MTTSLLALACNVYTDGAAESTSSGFEEFLADLNVQHLMSIPESQHQNGTEEESREHDTP